MRSALFSLLLLISPAAAQEPPSEPGLEYGLWKAEPGSENRAATLEYLANENLSYGFSCWKNHWLFFFNYQAPEGGKCEDHEECESNVAEVDLTFEIPERPAAFDRFTLFENYYFQDQALSILDIEAMIKARHFRLTLDDKLKAIWERDDFDFMLAGFEKAVNENQKFFSCALHAPIPIPPQRPIEIATVETKENAANAKAAPEKAKMEKARAVKAVKSALGKRSKARKAKARKSKLAKKVSGKKSGGKKYRNKKFAGKKSHKKKKRG